jgi:hypothetical protein
MAMYKYHSPSQKAFWKNSYAEPSQTLYWNPEVTCPLTLPDHSFKLVENRVDYPEKTCIKKLYGCLRRWIQDRFKNFLILDIIIFQYRNWTYE